MSYNTPDFINSFLSSVNVGDIFVAIYPTTTKICVVSEISLGIHGNSFSIPYSKLLNTYITQAHTLISVNSIDEAYSLYPELFL